MDGDLVAEHLHEIQVPGHTKVAHHKFLCTSFGHSYGKHEQSNFKIHSAKLQELQSILLHKSFLEFKQASLSWLIYPVTLFCKSSSVTVNFLTWISGSAKLLNIFRPSCRNEKILQTQLLNPQRTGKIITQLLERCTNMQVKTENTNVSTFDFLFLSWIFFFPSLSHTHTNIWGTDWTLSKKRIK